MKIVNAFFMRTPAQAVRPDELASSMHAVASEARSIEARLSKSDWVVGETISAADIVIFPSLQILLRALAKPEARDLSSRFLPLNVNYPALSRWVARVEALPGYERTYPPHWRETAP
jgi:glutathione S-transferase